MRARNLLRQVSPVRVVEMDREQWRCNCSAHGFLSGTETTVVMHGRLPGLDITGHIQTPRLTEFQVDLELCALLPHTYHIRT